MAKIVVLDDQPEICDFISDRLTDDGHEVRISHVGDEAIDFGYLFQPDVLITDWRLGSEYNGLEVAEAYRFANDQVKTILITGYSVEQVQNRLDDVEIFATVLKPFSLDEISRVVSDALEQGQLNDFAI